MSKGKGRSWGYVSYDVDEPEKDKLTYTSYETRGSVNRYTDNGDGGHSHEHWEDEEDYNSGEEPDQQRMESSDSKNPPEDEKLDGCYLTTACMNYFGVNFDDNCYQLFVLRWFRDNYVLEEDVKLYYELAPKIVTAIEKLSNKEIAYNYIFEYIIDACITAIENGDYSFAYDRYKSSVLSLSKHFI